MVDDLAKGQFRTGGATRKSLYLFAFVYGMTYSFSNLYEDGIEENLESDIEKNLFRDYYTNNLMRYVSESFRKKKSDFELDPTGQGINYKNFAEVIYIYYLTQDMSPEEKLKRSNEMINRVQKAGSVYSNPQKERTNFYRNFFKQKDSLLNEDVLSLDEPEFEAFIRSNYDSNTQRQTYSIGALQLENEQETAHKVYKNIIDEIEKRGVELEECNYGLWFTDVSAFKDPNNEIYKKIPEDKRDKFDDFLELLRAIDDFMDITEDEEEVEPVKRKALSVSSPNEVTRTSMIVAYYYLYNIVHEEDNTSKNFKEFYNSFKRDLDRLLIQSYYQPLSSKNIFDVLVVFSAYTYLNF